MDGLQENLSSTITASNSKIIYRDSEPIYSFCLNSVSELFFIKRKIIDLFNR